MASTVLEEAAGGGSGAEKTSAVIVHYRTPELTVAAAKAVAETAPRAEIVVVDNASHDAIAARLAAEVPRARVLVEAVNRGYGTGCNRGARETARGPTSSFSIPIRQSAPERWKPSSRRRD